MKKSLPENIILIDKPKGITSFDVIRKLRKKLGIKKMGHAGTLDPLATGLMIIGINDGTKKLNEFLKLDKTYIAEILFGIHTDTGDIDGEVLKEVEVVYMEEDYVKDVVNNFFGVFELPVPKYSAIKKEGKPLYKYARSGEEVEIPIKKMEVYKSKFIDLKEFKEGFILKAEFDVASGVYIRSLVEYLAKFLDTEATLFNLNRTRVGEFNLKDAERL